MTKEERGYQDGTKQAEELDEETTSFMLMMARLHALNGDEYAAGWLKGVCDKKKIKWWAD